MTDRSRLDLRALLEQVEAAAPVDAVTVVAAELSAAVAARAVSFLIADFSGHSLVRLGTVTPSGAATRTTGTESADTLDLAGSDHGEVLRTQRPLVTPGPEGTRVLVPVTDRGDALGVLELVLPDEPGPEVLADVAAAGHALAYVLIANRRHTDLFEWGQRTTPFSLAAEIQRRLLPASFTCEAGQFTVSGWLEPAATVGGDTFDWSLDRHSLQVSITDAVGHDVAAALLATLLVGCLRNERRRGADLAAQTRAANDAVAQHGSHGQFVTGQVLRVDLTTGAALLVNAGHPAPLRLRDGVVEELELLVDLPFGVQRGRDFRLQEFELRPGDRLVFLTDGMQERDAAAVDVVAAVSSSAGAHPRQVVHALGSAVVRAVGQELSDDATVVCLDWYGGELRPRSSDSGASAEHAST
ncbi:Serine phosphatase RsbU, regulator of sigma subunit [Klenkia soli]|uniref:Serine phosphatase RsbU, regulator of sigma subunit n=1 Tax=Klenkia soli TaxID=1052260 RepID=A0A1H0HJN5_9ACTN|nr:PP2C family protein-serine/threonine phosphatase [Klenkia soli]SDO19405.1 Serine phosphatase RsbU, regulator of sigma subunit [Klenkia soli]